MDKYIFPAPSRKVLTKRIVPKLAVETSKCCKELDTRGECNAADQLMVNLWRVGFRRTLLLLGLPRQQRMPVIALQTRKTPEYSPP